MLIKGRTDAGTDAVIMGEKLPYTKPCNIWLIQGRYLRGGRLGKTRAVTINNPPTHWLTRLMIIWSSATAVTAFHIRPNSWYMSCGRNITSTCRNNQILFIWFSCFLLFVCSPTMITLYLLPHYSILLSCTTNFNSFNSIILVIINWELINLLSI